MFARILQRQHADLQDRDSFLILLIFLCIAAGILPRPSNFRRNPPRFRIVAIGRHVARERKRERKRVCRRLRAAAEYLRYNPEQFPIFFRRASPRDSAAICQCKPAYLNWPRAGANGNLKSLAAIFSTTATAAATAAAAMCHRPVHRNRQNICFRLTATDSVRVFCAARGALISNRYENQLFR